MLVCMPRSDYRLVGPPDALTQLRGRLIGFGFGFIGTSIIVVIVATSGVGASLWLWTILAALPIALLAAAVVSLQQIRARFPEARDPERYDQKTLPPIPTDSRERRLIPVRGRKLKIEVSAALAIIPILIFIASAMLWLREAIGLAILLGAIVIIAWVVVTFVQGGLTIVDGERAEIAVDRNEIRIPRILLPYTSRRALRGHGKKLVLKWSDVSSWIVKPGDSEGGPAVYEVHVIDKGKKRTYEIVRSLLRGKEHELLDAIRSVGQTPVILKDSADH